MQASMCVVAPNFRLTRVDVSQAKTDTNLQKSTISFISSCVSF